MVMWSIPDLRQLSSTESRHLIAGGIFIDQTANEWRGLLGLEAGPMTIAFDRIYRDIQRWAENHSVHVADQYLPPGTAGEFDGLGVVMNSSYDADERAYYLIHALGSIVLWSLDKAAIQKIFADLRAAKIERD